MACPQKLVGPRRTCYDPAGMRRSALLVALAMLAAGRASAERPPGLCATGTSEAPAHAPYVAVLSAFPAELTPLVANTTIDRTVTVDGTDYHLGRLAGVNVVLGLLGIGMVNAEQATERLFAAFEVAAVVVSGVAGSHHRIGDVVIASQWGREDRERGGRANPALLALARRTPALLPPAAYQRCTPIPPTDPEAPEVCMAHEPTLVFEDLGTTGDDFGGQAFPCIPDGDEIFGCGLPGPVALATAAAVAYPDVIDMETAVVARVAARHGIPFLGVRGVSDGAGDPLGDRGFPAQFFDYYRLAAYNAAVVTRAVVTEISTFAHDPAGDRVCRRLARARWRAAAKLIRFVP